MESEGIYLLREREFIRLNEDIYKIGRSKHIKTRMNSYPKGSVIELMIGCVNSIQCEKDLLAIFRKKYIEHREYGAEYFEGNKLDMINTITRYLNTPSANITLQPADNIPLTEKDTSTGITHTSCSLYREQHPVLHINNMKIIDNAGCLFWMDKNNFDVYEITSDNEIGACVGKYDTKQKSIIT